MRLGRNHRYAIKSGSSSGQSRHERLPPSVSWAHLKDKVPDVHFTAGRRVPVGDRSSLLEHHQISALLRRSKKAKSLDKPINVPTPQLSPAADGECRKDSKVPVLFQYMSSKYGTPIEHLQHLSSKGTFKTNQIDSSSSGDGPVIYCPHEANICLPTPLHLVNASPTLCPLMTTDSGEACHVPPQIKRETRKGKTVYRSDGSIEAEATLHLKFESRFEGGNLQRAIQM